MSTVAPPPGSAPALAPAVVAVQCQEGGFGGVDASDGGEVHSAAALPRPLLGPLIGCFFTVFLPFFFLLTFLGDFNLQKLPSRRLLTLWGWKNRVLLEEYYTFNVAISLEVE